MNPVKGRLPVVAMLVTFLVAGAWTADAVAGIGIAWGSQAPEAAQRMPGTDGTRRDMPHGVAPAAAPDDAKLTAIPEPKTFAILALGGLALLRRRGSCQPGDAKVAVAG